MSGMDSSTFAFDNSTKSFSMRRPFVVRSVTPETLLSYSEKFIQVSQQNSQTKQGFKPGIFKWHAVLDV